MVFVNREEEFRALEDAFDMFRRGHLHGVIVYGFRKVGKTALVRRFVEKHSGYLLDLSWVNSVESLAKLVSQRVGVALDNLPGDPAEAIAVALKRIDEKLSEEGRVSPVVLDEFHVLLERLPKKIAKRYGLRMDEIFTDIVWKLRGVITSSRNAFWILVSSVGWVMLREYLEERKKAKGALLGVLGRLHVKPLSRDACMELARALMRSADEDAIGGVAELSGGIPKIVEVLAMRYNTTRENPLKLAINAMTDGEFDELFEGLRIHSAGGTCEVGASGQREGESGGEISLKLPPHEGMARPQGRAPEGHSITAGEGIRNNRRVLLQGTPEGGGGEGLRDLRGEKRGDVLRNEGQVYP